MYKCWVIELECQIIIYIWTFSSLHSFHCETICHNYLRLNAEAFQSQWQCASKGQRMIAACSVSENSWIWSITGFRIKARCCEALAESEARHADGELVAQRQRTRHVSQQRRGWMFPLTSAALTWEGKLQQSSNGLLFCWARRLMFRFSSSERKTTEQSRAKSLNYWSHYIFNRVFSWLTGTVQPTLQKTRKLISKETQSSKSFLVYIDV